VLLCVGGNTSIQTSAHSTLHSHYGLRSNLENAVTYLRAANLFHKRTVTGTRWSSSSGTTETSDEPCAAALGTVEQALRCSPGCAPRRPRDRPRAGSPVLLANNESALKLQALQVHLVPWLDPGTGALLCRWASRAEEGSVTAGLGVTLLRIRLQSIIVSQNQSTWILEINDVC